MVKVDWSWVVCSTVVPWTACARHRITGQRYLDLLHAQDGVCAVCRGGNRRLGQVVPLHIDHDHVCCPGKHSCGRCVRGLHCSPCGTLVGFIENDGGTDPSLYLLDERTERAMHYLAERGIDPADPVRQRQLLEGYEGRFLAGGVPPVREWLDRLQELRTQPRG